MLQQLNTDFYQKLKEQHPNLTSRELKLCALLCIDMETKDIASVFSISPDSVNKNRYRLRKKLQLDKSQDLITYLKSR